MNKFPTPQNRLAATADDAAITIAPRCVAPVQIIYCPLNSPHVPKVYFIVDTMPPYGLISPPVQFALLNIWV